jgi:hypothetical protein
MARMRAKKDGDPLGLGKRDVTVMNAAAGISAH